MSWTCSELVIKTKQWPSVKVLDLKARGPEFKTANWRQGWPNLSLFQVWSNEYQELLGTYLYKANCLLVVTLQPWDVWIKSLKRRQKNLFFKLLIIFNYTSRGMSQLVNACSKSATHWPNVPTCYSHASFVHIGYVLLGNIFYCESSGNFEITCLSDTISFLKV